MILNQRSQDILAANNWNVCQYAILLMMVAQSVDMIPGELLHVIADAISMIVMSISSASLSSVRSLRHPR